MVTSDALATTARAAVKPRTAPELPQLFAELHICGPEVEAYLRDAETRYKRSEFDVNTSESVKAILRRNAGDLKLVAAVKDCKSKVWTRCGNGVLKFRDRIQEMVLTVLDLKMHKQGAQEVDTCLERLQELFALSSKHFEEHTQSLEEIVQDLTQKMEDSLQAHDRAKPWYLSSYATGSLVLWPLACTCTRSLRRRRRLPAHRLGGLWGGVYVAGGIIMARGFMLHGGACQQQKMATVYELNSKFVEQTKFMWDGVMLQVRDLREYLDALQHLDHESSRVREMRLQRVVRNLWGMSMAIDEFIVWLEVRGYFPPCLSIADYVGAEKYSKLRQVIPGRTS